MKELYTASLMAKKLGVDLHRVTYIIRARKIPSLAMIGHTRVFDRAAYQKVKEEISAQERNDRRS